MIAAMIEIGGALALGILGVLAFGFCTWSVIDYAQTLTRRVRAWAAWRSIARTVAGWR